MCGWPRPQKHLWQVNSDSIEVSLHGSFCLETTFLCCVAFLCIRIRIPVIPLAPKKDNMPIKHFTRLERMNDSLQFTCSCALCISLYGQISLLFSSPAAKLHSFICSHCAAMLFTILRAILFVTIHETQASVCVTGDLGYKCARQGPGGGRGAGGE